jgi:hypothetical protein
LEEAWLQAICVAGAKLLWEKPLLMTGWKIMTIKIPHNNFKSDLAWLCQLHTQLHRQQKLP